LVTTGQHHAARIYCSQAVLLQGRVPSRGRLGQDTAPAEMPFQQERIAALDAVGAAEFNKNLSRLPLRKNSTSKSWKSCAWERRKLAAQNAAKLAARSSGFWPAYA